MSNNDWGTAIAPAHVSQGNYRMSVLDAWREAVKAHATAQEAERKLRAEVISLFSDMASNEMSSGMETVPTGIGKLKIEHKLDYKLDADTDKVDTALDQIEKSMEGGNIVAERLVKWKPEISVREYKLLDAKQKAIVDKVLTIKPASKSVKLEPVVG